MATMKSDELNILGVSSEPEVDSRNILPIDDFFDGMYLTDSEKEARTSFAKNLFLILSAILVVIKGNELLENEHDIEGYKDYIKENCGTLYRETFGSDKYSTQVWDFAEFFVDSTMRNINKPYFTSDDRATVNAENQTNAVFNLDEYQKAIDSGKTQKTWLTKHDKRVRHTHVDADGQTVAIDRPFEVGGTELMFPCDPLGSAKEIVNCRCQVIYGGLPEKSPDEELE